MVNESVGPSSVCIAGSSVSLRSPQYGMTLSRRQFSVGFFHSLHGPQSLTFYLCIFYFFILNLGPSKKIVDQIRGVFSF